MNKILLRLRKSIFKKFGLSDITPKENNSLEYLNPEATKQLFLVLKLLQNFH